ncbi:hypothetical protein [Staphylococcus caprae]|uniref:hypothetical protein n=1 Tax=Staphylococcus caprae TaxID=29380 RepID=UPI00118B74DD|nr:hypothetical protein [Staphylococcus caprae]QDW94025.1 hypothetical protein DWB96_07280 [Staphylococcus caprae]
MPQATIDKLYLNNNSFSGNQEKLSSTVKPVNTNKIQYINANCTPEEEPELQHQLAHSNRETRQREQAQLKKVMVIK